MSMPPASLDFLVLSLRAQAEVHMGLYSMPGQEAAKDLVMARHAIDLLAVLQEKTKGNLSLEEQRLVENSLTELRFRFVQASQSPASAEVTGAPPSDDQPSAEPAS